MPKKTFKVSFSDFLGDTGLLSNEQIGFYVRLLYWVDRLGGLPEERIEKMMKHYNITLEEAKPILERLNNREGLFKESAPKKKEKDNMVFISGIILPWDTLLFKEAWEGWKGYKKAQHNFTYKDSRSEQATLNKLFQDCNGIESVAIAAIEHSIACTYKGIYKNNENGQSNNQTGGKQRPDSIESMQAVYNQLNGGFK